MSGILTSRISAKEGNNCAEVGKTKGTSFVNAQVYCDTVHGAGAWARVRDRMDPADREVLNGLVAVGWYELDLYARAIRAIDRELGAGDLGLIAPLGRFEAERDFKTIHRLFFRLANPAYAIEKATEYWRRFHDTGSWSVVRNSPTSVSGSLEGWAATDSVLCLELTGYMPRVIELVGGESALMTHPRCRMLGHSACEFDLRWS